ncbi:MAG: biopolymer transporter ExbD [Planctomycetaceae bacterium]|nr:biopolymer transporter ExbD [Planctomycetaceae bacterium]MBT4012905.1 biopolymer transporter ExbD [Planctomycetaceae bacterium]MBT4723597.1 biopolymer transporter ExbD [Planctomycetaceae bacterium]MBT4845228.1 biopolymer transporter ExbD [Planctomycetaceae bacterium]MBT5123113.1 biopolymer transporter ExbD [Planctomycetaceae bacterium]
MKPIQRQRRPGLRMELSPLIDCIFQLLIFFMLSSTFLTPSIKLTLPTAEAGSVSSTDQIMVTLSSDDTIHINKQQVTFETLGPEIRQLLKDTDKKVITIRGDSDIKFSAFVRALDIAKQNGAVNVNIAHQTD